MVFCLVTCHVSMFFAGHIIKAALKKKKQHHHQGPPWGHRPWGCFFWVMGRLFHEINANFNPKATPWSAKTCRKLLRESPSTFVMVYCCWNPHSWLVKSPFLQVESHVCCWNPRVSVGFCLAAGIPIFGPMIFPLKKPLSVWPVKTWWPQWHMSYGQYSWLITIKNGASHPMVHRDLL